MDRSQSMSKWELDWKLTYYPSDELLEPYHWAQMLTVPLHDWALKGESVHAFLPVQCQPLWIWIERVLIMIRISGEVSSIIVRGIGQGPVRWTIWNWVAHPLDIIEQLTMTPNTIELWVDDLLNKLFWFTVTMTGGCRGWSLSWRVWGFGGSSWET
jgi:hypothetical protein